jgi:Kef-type K+ transport system membrane component KefB
LEAGQTEGGATQKPQPIIRAGSDPPPNQSQSPAATIPAGAPPKTFKGLTFWRVLIIISIVISLTAFIVEWQRGLVLEYFRQGRPFDRFAVILVAVVILPPLVERMRLPGLLGLILIGVLFGPHGLALVAKVGEVGHFFSDMGRVFLMFIAGLEISLSDFRRYAKPSTLFGVATFAGPMIGGFMLGQEFGFSTNASVLIGSLLASHTLLGYPILVNLGLVRRPFALTTIGATIFTDIASLLVLAVCLSVHVSGILNWFELVALIGALAVYCVFVMGAIPWFGGLYIEARHHDEMAQFQFVLTVIVVCAIGAKLIGLEDIVGAFLCGIAINQVLPHGPAREKLEFMGRSLFIPAFLIVIGAEMNLPVFLRGLLDDFPFVLGMIVLLSVGKFIAAFITAWFYQYRRSEMLSMWALSLPQLAATLAATVTAHQSMNAAGERLIGEEVVNAVIVLMVLTATVGPILTERFGLKVQQGGLPADMREEG